MVNKGTILILAGIIGLLFFSGLELPSQLEAITTVNICTANEPPTIGGIILALGGNNNSQYIVQDTGDCPLNILNLNLTFFDDVDKVKGTDYSRNIYVQEALTTNSSAIAPGTNGTSCTGSAGLNFTYTCLDRSRTQLSWFKCDNSSGSYIWQETPNIINSCPKDQTFYWCNEKDTITIKANTSGLVGDYFNTFYTCKSEQQCDSSTDCATDESCTEKQCQKLSCSGNQIIQNHACLTVECTSNSTCTKQLDTNCDGSIDAMQGSCSSNICAYPTQEECPSFGPIKTNEQLLLISAAFIIGGMVMNRKKK